MRDMALQIPRYYATGDRAASQSATKEFGLLTTSRKAATSKLPIRYPQQDSHYYRTDTIPKDDVKDKQHTQCNWGGGTGKQHPSQETRSSIKGEPLSLTNR